MPPDSNEELARMAFRSFQLGPPGVGDGDDEFANAEIAEVVGLATSSNGPAADAQARIVWASQVEREQVEWIDPKSRFIPRRALTVLAGQPGLGKSMYSTLIAAGLSREGRRSLIFTAEDSWSITVRPRLEACEADLDLVGYAEISGDNGLGGAFTFPDDTERLAGLVSANGIEFVVIDPLVSHLTRGVNSWNDQSIRTALAPLAALADKHDLGIVGVGHLNKREDIEVLMRIGGSIGIGAAARSVLLLSTNPDDDEGKQRIVARVKCNLDAPVPSCVFQVEPVVLPPANGNPEITTARLRFLSESDHRSDELLRRWGSEDREARSEAEQFLLEELAHAPRPSQEISGIAGRNGISEKAIRNAKKRLGVRSEKHGFGPGGSWYLLLEGQTLEGVQEQQLLGGGSF